MPGDRSRRFRAPPFSVGTVWRIWGPLTINAAAMFTLAGLLEDYVGEFWSQAAFLPIWGTAFWLFQAVSARGGKNR